MNLKTSKKANEKRASRFVMVYENEQLKDIVQVQSSVPGKDVE